MSTTPVGKSSLVDFADRCHDVIVNNLSLVKFDRDQRQHAVSLGLYCRILQQFKACIVLARNGLWSSIPILGRSMCESYIDLKALIADESYIDTYYAKTVSQYEKQVKEVESHPSPLKGELDQVTLKLKACK